VVMGDFNGGVGGDGEEDAVGPFGLGMRSDIGEGVVASVGDMDCS
jgi:hypothetical protein